MKKLDGTEVMRVEFGVPVDYILKLAGDDTEDVLDRRTTFGWRFEYLGKSFGDYITIIEDLKDGKLCRLPLEEMKEVKELLKEQAQDIFIHRALLIDSLSEYLKAEIDDRLREKYYPVVMDSGKTYVTYDQDRKRVYHRKFSFKYLSMVIKHTFAKLISDLLFKLI